MANMHASMNVRQATHGCAPLMMYSPPWMRCRAIVCSNSTSSRCGGVRAVQRSEVQRSARAVTIVSERSRCHACWAGDQLQHVLYTRLTTNTRLEPQRVRERIDKVRPRKSEFAFCTSSCASIVRAEEKQHMINTYMHSNTHSCTHVLQT